MRLELVTQDRNNRNPDHDRTFINWRLWRSRIRGLLGLVLSLERRVCSALWKLWCSLGIRVFGVRREITHGVFLTTGVGVELSETAGVETGVGSISTLVVSKTKPSSTLAGSSATTVVHVIR